MSAAEVSQNYLNMRVAQLRLDNPIWEEFFDSLEQSEFDNYQFAGNDPALDADPYFLRSQSWSGKASNKNIVADILDGYYFSKTSKAVTIRVPGAQKFLNVGLPLTPFQVTDEFIFFSADKTSTIFENKVADIKGDTAAEGMFFVSRNEIETGALNNEPVSFYFFPLPGSGWKGEVLSYDLGELDTLSISNGTDILPINIEDVRTLMKYQQLIRMLTVSETLKKIQDVREMAPGRFTYPPANSTAGFGIVGVSARTNSYARVTRDLIETLQNIFLPQAKAFDLPPHVVEQLFAYGKVIGALLAGAVILKYTIYKDKLKQIQNLERSARREVRRELIEQRKQGKEVKLPKSPGPVAQGTRDVLTVFAHGTTLLTQLPAVTLGTAIQLFANRFFPESAAAPHKLVHKILDKTFYWAKRGVSKIAVNWKTFVLGSVVLGLAVDTPFVTWQDLSFFPWLMGMVATWLPGAAGQYVNHVFVSNLHETLKVAIAGIFRGGAGWTLSGASHFSIDVQQQNQPRIEAEVDEELRTKGLDPQKRSVQAQREEMIKQKQDRTNRQRGLPGRESFLFDLTTIFEKVQKFVGFDPQGNYDQSFALEAAPSLAKNAVRKALKHALMVDRNSSTVESRQIIELLRSLLKDMSLMDFGLIRNPKEKFNRMRETRRVLTILSYDGDLASLNVPSVTVVDWARKYSPGVADIAGLYYRKALFSYLSREGNTLLVNSRETVEKYFSRAHASVQKEYDAQTPVVSFADFIKNNKQQYDMLIDARIRELHDEEIEQAKKANYSPPEIDWLARRQKEKATQIAIKGLGADLSIQSQLIAAKTPEALAAVTKKYNIKWKENYSYALSHVVGLNVGGQTEANLLERVHAQTAKVTDEQTEKTPGLKNYISQMAPFEQLKFESDLYAVNFLATYRELTVHDVERATHQNPTADFKRWKDFMISPDQPGRFQKIRQTNIVRNSRVLTRILRWGDSWFDDEANALGVSKWAKRNIPLWHYLSTSVLNASRGMIGRLTLGYGVMVSLFHVNWSWATFALFAGFASPFFIAPPIMWLNNFFKQQGMKVMDSVWSKAKYALPYSIATMWATIPFLLLNEPLNNLFDQTVIPQMKAMVSSVPTEIYSVSAVATAIGVSTRVRGWIGDGYNKLKGLVRGKPESNSIGSACTNLFAP